LGTVAFLLCCQRLPAAEPDHSSSGAPLAPLTSRDALEKFIAHQEATLTNQLRAIDQQAHASGKSEGSLGTYILVFAGVVVALVVLRKGLPALVAPFISGEEAAVPEPVSNGPDAHEEAFSGYLEQINAQQKQPARTADAKAATELKGEASDIIVTDTSAGAEPSIVSHVNALDQVMSVRALFLDLNHASEPQARKEALTNLLEAARGLRKGLRVSAAYPIGQLASALDGLLSQVASQDENLTASVLRTVAGAIDLLPSLCGPAIRSDLASNPPITLLAVDDDPVIRHALTCALKRVWARPDLAEDGHEGLALVETRAYDLVFVDIEMPGMDGFELCYRIHATALNSVTPVIFVTSHNDLASRARSSLAGGLEFLGKPFLSAELTLKALTLVLKRRLQGSMQRVTAPAGDGAQKSTPAAIANPKGPLCQPTAAVH
jgi:CheY-like chemotaxis protein